MVENCTIRFAFRAKLSMSAIHRRCAGDPLGQIAERCQLQPATTSQVGLRDKKTRLYCIKFDDLNSERLRLLYFGC